MLYLFFRLNRFAFISVFTFVVLWIGLFAGTSTAFAAQYYVDAGNGADTNTGTSPSAPWKTLSKINNTSFTAGDIVNFNRGGVWIGTLTIQNSGASGTPITFQSYGSGIAPQIKNPGVQWSHGINISGSWIVVRDFLITDQHEAGISIANGANHNVVQNIECTRDGQCIMVLGQYNLVTRNNAHDLTMIVNDTAADNDYGATGYNISNSDNELSYNKCTNCIASSTDYGNDGGFIEFYNGGTNSYVHHNYALNTNGFAEFGGQQGVTLSNIRIAYNVLKNTQNLACIHNTGSFGVSISNLKFENNTIDLNGGYRVLGCMDTSGTQNSVFVRNNIVFGPVQISDTPNFTHDHNIFFMTNGGSPGIPLGTGDLTSDPKFINQSIGDYHLQSGSPAIDAGVNLGYGADYDGVVVPQGSSPDMGAFEFAPTTLAINAFTPSNDASNAYYKITYTGTPTFVRVFLDTDKTTATGYVVNGVGADYLMENGYLYRYSGTSGAWGWTLVRSIVYTNTNGIANATIVRSDIGSPSSLNALAQIANSSTTVNSSIINQTFADTSAPTAPTNLSGSAVSSSRINLSWSTSTDNVGVVGYKVFRNGTMIATTSAVIYADTGLAPSTAYTYAVSAYDAAGNNSAQSIGVTVSTWPAFTLGDRVQTTATVNVRSKPGTSSRVRGLQASGVSGAIVGGPQSANGYTWWDVNFDSGADGWVVQDYLAKSLSFTSEDTEKRLALYSRMLIDLQEKVNQLSLHSN